MRDSVSDLRRRLATIVRPQEARAQDLFALDIPDIDTLLEGGLARGCLHEVYARGEADAGAACGFAAALAAKASENRSVLWVRQAFCDVESGCVSGTGLAEMGIDPDRVIMVRPKKALDVLRAAADGARCAALGSVILEPWGEPKELDFTATRRLSLAAEKSGVTLFLVRLAARTASSSAATRWQVESGASRPLAANAPGYPSFTISLLRQRAGQAGASFHVEWNRDEHIFREVPAVSSAVVSLPVSRPVAKVSPLARAG